MADMKDNLFGTLAVRGHFVLNEQVNEALAVQLQFEQGGQKAPRLGEILAAKGYMTPEQVQAVLRGQGTPQGKLFGEVASAWHFCTQEDVESAAAFQKEQKTINQRAPRIGEILVARGAMKPHQIRAVLQVQGKQIVMCPACGTRYNALNLQASSRLKCPRCQVVFAPMSSATRPEEEDVRADITVSLPAIKVETSAMQTAKMEVGPYQLSTKLGADHSGILYKALHPQTGNHVALRLLSSQVMQGAEDFDLWVSAGQTATELNHPNLQRILSMGSEGGRAYLVMEFVEGKSIRQRMAEQGRIAALEALEIMIQAGDALAYGHSRDLIHGDLRPNHILIGFDGRVRLSGLGTPKQVMKDLKLMSEKSGSVPLYTAPEVLISEDTSDERSDIYSLCAIGYQMITGRPPQEGSDVMQAGMRIAAQDIATPRSLDPGITPYIERMLLKGLSPEPEDRYPSIVALLADLRKCRGGLLIQAQDLAEVAPEIRPGAQRTSRSRFRNTRAGRRLTTHLVRSGKIHSKVGRTSGMHGRAGSKSGLTPAVKSSGIQASVKASGLNPSVKSSGTSAHTVGKKASGQYASAKTSGMHPSAKTSGMHPSSARGSGLNPAVKRSGDHAKALAPDEALREWTQMMASSGAMTPGLSAALEPATPEGPAPVVPNLTVEELTSAAQGEQALTNLTPTGQAAVPEGQGRKRRRGRSDEEEVASGTIIGVILGSAAILILGLWIFSRFNQPVTTTEKVEETEKAPAQIEKETPEEKLLAKSKSDYVSIIENYQKVNPQDHKGVLRAIDEYLGKYEKAEPQPPGVKAAHALRKKTTAAGVAATLPELQETVKKFAAEDKYTEAAAAIAKWQIPWGEDGAETAAGEKTRLADAEKHAAEAQFTRVKTLRDAKDWAGALKLCDEIGAKFSADVAARAREEKALTERAERDAKTTAQVEAEKKKNEQIAAEKEKNAPGRYDQLVKDLQAPLKTLDITFAGQLIETAGDALTGTAKGPAYQSLKGEFKLYQDMLERMNKTAKEGKLRDLRVRYQGETVSIIDAGASGPVVNVKGGRMDAKWPELETEALIEIARRATSAEKGNELHALGLYLLLLDKPYDAEKALKSAAAKGALVDELIAKAAAREREIAGQQKKEEEPTVPGKWTAPSYVKLPLGKQSDATATALKDMGWEISKGIWTVTSEKTLFGEKDELNLVSIKRDVKRFQALSVEMRGNGEAMGFSFGKGLRFLTKPSGRWQKIGLEIGAGDLVKFMVDGQAVKSIEDTGEVNSEKLGDAMYLRCEGAYFEVRDYRIDGRPVGTIEIPWAAIAEAAKRNTNQRPADTDRLKAWGWELSEGIWSVTPEQSWLGVPNAQSNMSNLKREQGKFSTLTVEMRGDAESAGFSFGKGLRFLTKATDKWCTLKLEVIGGDLLRLTVNGDVRKSLDDVSNVKTSDLPGILYLRGVGGVVEFRNFQIDGKAPAGPAPAPGPGPVVKEPGKDDEKEPVKNLNQDPKETEALKKLGWEISKGVWKTGANGELTGTAADGTQISIKTALKRFSTITVEMRGDADAAGFSFGTGMRFVVKPSDKWQVVKLQIVEGDHLQLTIDGDPRNSLEDTGKITTDQFGDSVYLRAEGQKIEFKNFKIE